LIEQHLRDPWPADVVETLARFKLGDLIEKPPFFYGVRPGTRLWGAGDEEGLEDPDGSQVDELHPDESPDYGIITTQTCDLSEQGPPRQPWFQVSPVYSLDEGDSGGLLTKGYIVELTPPDLPGGRWVADLRIEQPLEKTVLLGREPIAGFATEREADDFGVRLGVRRARAALADGLVKNVIRLIGRRKRNNKPRAAAVWSELYKLGLQIEEGSRTAPTAVRLHVICSDEPSALVKQWFAAWEDRAREEAAKVGITLLTTAYHDSRSMDIKLADRLIDLSVS
jgi:hypothetical protein